MLESNTFEKIKALAPKAVCDEAMCDHTTFRIGGKADAYVSIDSEEELIGLIRICKEEKIDYFIIGNGSNLLVSDKGYRGLIMEIGKDFSGIELQDNRLKVKAGTLMSRVSRFALDKSLTGFEFASGIPGTIGGGVIMNAGAYGGEMKQVTRSVRLLDKEGNISTLTGEEMEFSYRNSRAKREGLIVLEVTLELAYGSLPDIEELMKELAVKRREKQPLEYPSAGSTFKRPEGYFAGKLISDCGLKGMSVGGAQVSEKHAGFIINTGKATASDVYELIGKVKDRVHNDFGVELEPEVIMVGEM